MTAFLSMCPRWLRIAGIAAAIVLGALFAVLPFTLVLGMACGLLVAVCMVRWPLFGLGLVAFTIPLERLGAYESAFGTIRASQVFAAMTIICWLINRFLSRRFVLRPAPIVIPLVVLFAIGVLGLTVTPNLSYSTIVLLLTVFTGIFSLLIPQIVDSEHALRRVVTPLIITSLLAGVFGFFQFFGDLVGLPASITGLRDLYTKGVFGFPRVQSTFLEPLYFANFLLIPIGIAYAAFLRHVRIGIAPILVLMILVANLILTVSRGGYIGLVVTIGVITVIGMRDFFRPKALIILSAALIVVAISAIGAFQFGDIARVNLETLQSQVQNVFSGASYNERVETYEHAVSAFYQSPLIGIGPGAFGPFVAMHPLTKPESGWKIVNNEPLELLAETGVFGLGAFVIIIGILITRSVAALRYTSSPYSNAIMLGLFGALVGTLAQYQTFSTLYIMHIWFLFGLIMATQNILFYQRNGH